MKKRVVITGLGVISSIGIGKDDFWQSLIQGKSGISKVDAFDTSQHTTHYGGQVREFNPAEFLAKEKIKSMPRASSMAIASAKLALGDSRLQLDEQNPNRIAAIMGTTAGEAQEIEKANRIWVRQGKEAIDSRTIIQSPVNNLSSNLARELNISGITHIFTTACAAGNYAISYGYDLIRSGKADYIIAGGSDAFSYLAFTGFNLVRAVAPERCQPFDKNRKGMIVAEGSAILIIEPLSSALKRKTPIYAEILGYGLSCDAYHMTAPHQQGTTRCIQKALSNANIAPEQIDYISAHGTGTLHNDKTESAAIKNVFGNKRIPVSSIKSMLGHAMGAASAIEAAACCLTLKYDIIPPTINYETPDPECDIDCVPNKARKQKVNIALNNSFAFGGNNCCLVLKKYIS